MTDFSDSFISFNVSYSLILFTFPFYNAYYLYKTLTLHNLELHRKWKKILRIVRRQTLDIFFGVLFRICIPKVCKIGILCWFCEWFSSIFTLHKLVNLDNQDKFCWKIYWNVSKFNPMSIIEDSFFYETEKLREIFFKFSHWQIISRDEIFDTFQKSYFLFNLTSRI